MLFLLVPWNKEKFINERCFQVVLIVRIQTGCEVNKMADQYYDTLRERYDGLVKDVVPKLTANAVDEAVEAVNTLVHLQRPVGWAFSDEPRVVLGITSDKQIAVYGEVGRFGFYHAVPVGQLRQRISEMADKRLLEDLVC